MKYLETIESILSIINPILKKDFDKKNDFPVGFTFYLVLERLMHSLYSIHILAKDNLLKNDHAIGLISRNILSDFIVTGFIIKFSTSEDEFYEKLYRLFNTDLKNIDGYLKVFNENGIITEGELNCFNIRYSNEGDIYKTIREYSEQHELKQFPTMRSIIVDFLKADQNDAWVKQVQSSYSTWTLLSKYEHLGWLSYEITRDANHNRAVNRLIDVLYSSIILAGSCLEILEEKNAMNEILDLMNHFIEPRMDSRSSK